MHRDTVSVVIPTHNRADLVPRAVCSALSQTYRDLEVIVVVDGPDEDTVVTLEDIQDARLRIVELPRSVGAASARNVGVDVAEGNWIALLDDDDEWVPDKIAQQMDRAKNSQFRYPIVSSQVLVKTKEYSVVWPRRMPSDPLCEYLLARKSWSYGDGLLSTITLLIPKELFVQVPFRCGLRRHQDLDWVLRALRCPGAGIEFITQPLAVWNQAEQRASVSTTADWHASLEWIESVRETITGRAYAGFLATHVAPQAARQHDWAAFPTLLKKMVMLGKPDRRDILMFLGMWSMPHQWRQIVRKAGR